MKLLKLILALSLLISIQSYCGDGNYQVERESDCYLDSEEKDTYDYCCYKNNLCYGFSSSDYENNIKNDNTYKCHDKSYTPYCESIEPSKSSDCKIKSEDTDTICCYYELKGEKGCTSFKDNDELEKAKKDAPSGAKISCNGAGDINKLGYINLFLSGLLLIIN